MGVLLVLGLGAATNKREAFNRFVQCQFFGGEGLIAEEGRDFDDEPLSRPSPYITEHVNWFGTSPSLS